MEWFLFLALIAVLLYVDLGILNKKDHEISVPEALKQSACWIGLSVLFGVFIVGGFMGGARGAEFFTAYIIEKSLSVDNLFVFLAIFTYFNISLKVQHRVLYWGILGAIILRFIAIAGGVTLIANFHWLTYVFGAILMYTAWKVTFGDSAESEKFDETPFAQFLQKHLKFDFSDNPQGRGKFFFQDVRWDAGKGAVMSTVATKLFFVLLILEATDLLFATDSIPAALACSNSAFVIFTSNIFAVLGLRSLYFALSAMMGKFQFLKFGVGLVLAMIGMKMLLAGVLVLPTALWLMMVALTLATSVGLSIIYPEPEAVEQG